MAFNKRIFSICTISALAIVVVGGITFGMTYYFINSNKKEINYVELAQKESFIRERTFSLKFNTTRYIDPNTGNSIKSSLFGTSWIFNKILNQEIYYLATNIHVVSDAISLVANEDNTYQIADYIESIELGYPNNPSVVSSHNDLSLEKITNKITFPEIVYTSSYIENTPTYSIPLSVSQNKHFYTYAMTDLAILKFDFSSTSSNFKNFLKYYDLRPTTFYANTLGENNFRQQNYFIGGYPFLEDINKIIGTWGFDSSFNESLGMVSGTIVSNVPQTIVPRGVLLPNNITNPATNSPTRYFQNISNQVTISNLILHGGSSGSMVINDNLEVVGIYWGSYSLSNSSNILGAFDILNTDKYNTIFPNRITGEPYRAYNRVDEIKLIINNQQPPLF